MKRSQKQLVLIRTKIAEGIELSRHEQRQWNNWFNRNKDKIQKTQEKQDEIRRIDEEKIPWQEFMAKNNMDFGTPPKTIPYWNKAVRIAAAAVITGLVGTLVYWGITNAGQKKLAT